jgi:hypothetical protein
MKSENFLYMRNANFLVEGLKKLIDESAKHLGDLSQINMVEIGSYLGESTLIFAEKFKMVAAIDPYINDYDQYDPTCSHADLNLVYEKFIENTSKINNIVHYRTTSDMFFEKKYITNVSIYYIDGVHTYEQVKKDITNSLKSESKKLIISGHDYSLNWKGVYDAIHDTIGVPDFVFEDTSFLKIIR